MEGEAQFQDSQEVIEEHTDRMIELIESFSEEEPEMKPLQMVTTRCANCASEYQVVSGTSHRGICPKCESNGVTDEEAEAAVIRRLDLLLLIREASGGNSYALSRCLNRLADEINRLEVASAAFAKALDKLNEELNKLRKEDV